MSADALTASEPEAALLRRELDRLTVKLKVLETTATASPMSTIGGAHTRLLEQVEQQRHALAAQSMELAVLRARYDGARSELERVQRVTTGSIQ